MLERLPREVFDLVLEQIPDRRDFKQLCAVSKTLYNLTLPKFYETLNISSESEEYLERIDIKSLLRGDPTSRLRHVKHFRISASFHKNLDRRCVHFRDLYDYIIHKTEVPIKFPKLTTDTLKLLQQLEDESLKSFSWKLGTCIPKQILGCSGYLPLKQASLEAITLITSGWLGRNDDSDNSDDGNDENIETRGTYYRNSFARECLGLKRSAIISEVIFPALTSLSLGFVPMKNAEKALSLFKISTNLTNLFLSVPGPIDTLWLWRSLAENRLPLTRFIYHQRSVDLDDDSDHFEEEMDLDDLSLLPGDWKRLKRASEQHPFAQLNLVCLGLSVDPFVLKSVLTSPNATKSLELLHIRKSGSDMAGDLEKRGTMFGNPDLASYLEVEDEDACMQTKDEDLEDDAEA